MWQHSRQIFLDACNIVQVPLAVFLGYRVLNMDRFQMQVFVQIKQIFLSSIHLVHEDLLLFLVLKMLEKNFDNTKSIVKKSTYSCHTSKFAIVKSDTLLRRFHCVFK